MWICFDVSEVVRHKSQKNDLKVRLLQNPRQRFRMRLNGSVSRGLPSCSILRREMET
jgi:hypothetical protein